MATINPKPKKENRFLRALRSARRMTPEERIQMLVEIGLMEQEEADKAKKQLQEK
ncbi:hypothetical protein P12x_000209 [Tundrisphaera lichenicola]|uniref:hypothetical protein n=1 Tax=Tundrisphaera lichenicola TaxID=2029860 RepID=UPI003EB8BB2D